MAPRPIRWFDPRDRRPHAPSIPQELWEQHRLRLRHMYLEQGMKLEEIMNVMEDEYSFAPSKRQYTSQFYSKWGFFKRAGRDQERRESNTAIGALIAETGGTESPPPSPAMQIGTSNNEATQVEVSPSVSVPPVHSGYTEFSRSLEADFPRVAPARQSLINYASWIEGASSKSEASAEKVERCQVEAPLNPPSEIACANDVPDESNRSDGASAPSRIDGCRSDKITSFVGFVENVIAKTEPHPSSPAKASSLPISAENKVVDLVDTTKAIVQDVGHSSWNMAMHSYDTNCNDGPREPNKQDQNFPTLCAPSEQSIGQFSNLSQTLLASPGSSLSGLSSMISLKNRISRNGVSSSQCLSSGSSCSSWQSALTTSSSMIVNHIFQNGRRYHAFGSTKYWGPDDEDAQDIGDISHHLWSLCRKDQLCFALEKNPKVVLDLGTGNGLWVVETADKLPEASVEGCDVSLIQPSWVPPNSQFYLEDFNDEWLTTHKYDFIHARELLGSVPDWMEMYRKIYRALNPGGWFDQAEPSIIFRSDYCTFDEDHPYSVWNKVMIEAGTRAGMEFDVGPKIEDRLKEVGFVNVQAFRKTWPIGSWTKDKDLKEIGSFNQARLTEGIHGLCSRRLMDEMGWSPVEIDNLCRELKKAFSTPKLYSCHWVYYVSGQKPADGQDLKPNETSPTQISPPVELQKKSSKAHVIHDLH